MNLARREKPTIALFLLVCVAQVLLLALVQCMPRFLPSEQIDKATDSPQPVGRIFDFSKRTPTLLVARSSSLSAHHYDHERQHSSTQSPEAARITQRESREMTSQRESCKQRHSTSNVARQKSLGSLLNGAKNMLTSGFSLIEQRAGDILWHGSNVLATLIPVASFLNARPSATTTPPSGQNKDQDRNQMSTSNSSRRGTTAAAAAAALTSLAQGGTGLQSRVDYVMGLLERSIEHLPNFPRLHPQECVKRTICEAHQEPTKFGAIGLILRMIFPASEPDQAAEEIDPAGSSSQEYKVINKYKHAAAFGLSRRIGGGNSNGSAGNGNASVVPYVYSMSTCKDKYEDCLVSLLEVGQNLVDFFLK